MYTVVARLGMAGALVVGAAVGTAAPAGAAERAKCAVGSWWLASMTSVSKAVKEDGGKGVTVLTTKGGVGTRLVVKKGHVAYRFNGSTKLKMTSPVYDGAVTGWFRYRKNLGAASSLTGNKTGVLSIDPGSVTGNATVTGKMLKPEKQKLGPWKLAPIVGAGGGDFLVPQSAKYTCSGKGLVLKWRGQENSSSYTVTTLRYRRT